MSFEVADPKAVEDSRFQFVILLLLVVLSPYPLLAHGDVHGQIVEITAEIAKSPTNSELFLKRGELHRVHQDWDAAHADFDHAFALNPKIETIDFSKGRLFLDANWPVSAKISLDRFLSKYTNHVEALVLRARALVKLEMRIPAVADYTRAINLSSESRPELYIERAQALAAESGSSPKEAVRGLDEGIKKLGPLVTLELCALDIEVKEKQYDDALKRLDTVIAKAPRKETWLARKGEILEQAGRPKEARETYASALKAMDTLPPTRRNVPALMDLEKRLREQLQKLK